MTPENRNAFQEALNELKRAITSSKGDGHYASSLVEQIEDTISEIEQKTLLRAKSTLEASFASEQALRVEPGFSTVLT